jgi:hypothetical protein
VLLVPVGLIKLDIGYPPGNSHHLMLPLRPKNTGDFARFSTSLMKAKAKYTSEQSLERARALRAALAECSGERLRFICKKSLEHFVSPPHIGLVVALRLLIEYQGPLLPCLMRSPILRGLSRAFPEVWVTDLVNRLPKNVDLEPEIHPGVAR